MCVYGFLYVVCVCLYDWLYVRMGVYGILRIVRVFVCVLHRLSLSNVFFIVVFTVCL